MLPYGHATATRHAIERVRRENAGTPPPFVDGQIAAIALVNNPILVTRNRRDFERYESPEEREKIRTRARRHAEGGHQATLEVARRLRAQWIRLHPEIDPARRRSDLESHLAVKQKLDAVAHGLPDADVYEALWRSRSSSAFAR